MIRWFQPFTEMHVTKIGAGQRLYISHEIYYVEQKKKSITNINVNFGIGQNETKLTQTEHKVKVNLAIQMREKQKKPRDIRMSTELKAIIIRRHCHLQQHWTR